MIEVLPEFLMWLLIIAWLPGIIFSMAVMDFKDRPLNLGFLLGLLLGPIGWIVACVLPSMAEDDLIRREVQRLRVERKAKTIIEREDAGTTVRQPIDIGFLVWQYAMIGGIVAIVILAAIAATLASS